MKRPGSPCQPAISDVPVTRESEVRCLEASLHSISDVMDVSEQKLAGPFRSLPFTVSNLVGYNIIKLNQLNHFDVYLFTTWKSINVISYRGLGLMNVKGVWLSMFTADQCKSTVQAQIVV